MATCTNGHETPSSGPCMYCGAPLMPTQAPMPMPQYGYGPPAQPVQPPPGSGPTSALAVTSLVLGVLYPVGSIPAIIVGLIALPRIRKRNQNGRGLAIAGIALGGIAVASALLGAIVIWSVADDTGTKYADSPACETDARTLVTASEAFYASEGRYPLTMLELVDKGYLSDTSELYRLKPNNQAMPDFVPINGACGGKTIRGG